MNRSTTDKIGLFRRCFGGRTDAYGTRDLRNGRARQVKQPVTDAVLLAHLQGRQPYGVYLLVNDQTRAVVADFDVDDLDAPMEFRTAARDYGLPTYLERSKSKGYHVWIFLDESGVSAAKARLVVRHILAEIGQARTEVFPKHDQLDARATYGNYIYAPLFGALVPRGRTVFLDPSTGFKPHADQWQVLADVERVTERQLDDLIEINELTPAAVAAPVPDADHSMAGVAKSFGLLPCAQRMLAIGVTDHQRVSCFRLAVHLKNVGLPQDLAVSSLLAWAAKNRPANGKRIITPGEVARQTRDAYLGTYRSCGCDEAAVQPFCDPRCSIRVRAASGPQPARGATITPERRKAMSDAIPNRPVKEFRAGGVRAAIWRNEQRGGEAPRVSHSIRIEKSYRDSQTRNWIQTDCFFASDLPKLRLVVEKAYEFIALNEREPDAEPGATAVEHDGAVTD